MYLYKLQEKMNIFNKVLLVLLICFPILVAYSTPINGITLPDAILILMFPYLIISEMKRKVKVTPVKICILVYMGYIFFSFFLLTILGSITDVHNIMMRMFRYLLYWAILFLLNYNINIQYLIKAYRIVCWIGGSLLIVQNIVLILFGVYISGHWLSPLVMSPSSISAFEEQISNIYTMSGRPYSFFSEPSTAGFFFAGMLCIELFYCELKNLKNAIFLSACIVIGMSNSGILLMGMLWGIYCIKKLLHKRSAKANALLLLPIGLIGSIALIFVMIRTGKFDVLISRITGSDVWGGRFSGFAIFAEKRSFIHTLFGCGMNDNYKVFLSGIPRSYYYFGLIGIMIILCMIFVVYIRAISASKVMIFMFIIAELGGTFFFGQSILTIMPFIILKGSRHEQDLFHNT